MKYIVYCHELNNKKYVGYTQKSVIDRLQQHINLANSGSSAYFHRAIRKYGIGNIKTLILFKTNKKELAIEKEIFYIKEFKTRDSAHGYNLTKGGDVGDCVGWMEGDRRDEWLTKLSNNTSGTSNPNHSGYSDEFLINEGVQFYLRNRTLGCNEWFAFSKEKGYPQTFSKNRFKGSFKYFVSLVQKNLDAMSVQYDDGNFDNSKNTYASAVRKILSDKIKGKQYYNDGKKNYIVKKGDEIVNKLNLIRGRIKPC
jgi:hypothetical protein